MRVLVTGASGYTGAHVCAALRKCRHKVVALVRPSSDLGLLRSVAGPVDVAVAANSADVAVAFGKALPQAVIHLAADYPGATAPDDIAGLIDVNVIFGTALVEAMLAAGCTKLVTAGTNWQYYNGPCELPNSLYAATKSAFRTICDYYAALRGLACTELRLFDSYGPADPRGKLLDLLTQAASTGQVLDMTPGEQVIYPIHVFDTASAFVHALTEEAAPPPGMVASWSVPGPEALTLKEMVGMLSDVLGVAVPVTWGARPYPPGQIMQPYIGTVLPGWQPELALAEGLRMVFGSHVS
ncbi:MAG: NAD(P)-dependent oxidoreductase [Rhodobiaceae bacterium]|nr:NAD(P)-dependent oxidoreductase [Rhodobiaceae bacterium]